MISILDIIESFDWIDRVEGFVSSFINADWRRANNSGPFGVLAELGRTAVGTNRWQIHIPRECDWSGAEASALLHHYGIKIWGRSFTSDTVCFFVKERQANWAEYLLLRRGIPVVGQLYNQDNAVYAQKYAPGDRPPAWADRGKRSALDRLDDLLL